MTPESWTWLQRLSVAHHPKRQRREDVRIKATKRLKGEVVRRSMHGVGKLMLYKGQPLRVEGQLLCEHKYSDHLMITLRNCHSFTKCRCLRPTGRGPTRAWSQR
jgi:hypothetical protein